jgi:transposase, IS6 family
MIRSIYTIERHPFHLNPWSQIRGPAQYLTFPISYRDLELMLLDRGVTVDHTTIFRWIQAYAVELEKRIRPHLRMSNGSWRVDETYIK